jgi:hypothetical protein
VLSNRMSRNRFARFTCGAAGNMHVCSPYVKQGRQ